MLTGEKILLGCLIVLGLCLRFVSLDSKAYWYDEAFTSLEVSGYSPHDASVDILTGKTVTGAELDKYQFPLDGSPKTVVDTAKGLIANEPQLTPLYFVLLRFWSELFNHSIAAVRAFSALFSVATLVFAYWLVRELFSTPRVAWFCVALMAISPFHLLYAQEARPYSMWTALVLLSSAVLLWALRRKGILPWILYSLCAAASLYTYLLSLLVIVGHGLFVLLEERFRVTKTVVLFSVAAGAGVLAFLPWPYRGQRSGAGNEAVPLTRYAIKWIRSVGMFFADFNLRDYTPKSLLIPYSVILLALVALCGYAIYFLWRHASRSQYCFVLTLIGTLGLCLSVLDFVTGSSASLVTRYLFPSFLGIQIALAYMFAMRTGGAVPLPYSNAWRWGAAGVALLGLASCLMIVTADVWWNKDPENYVQTASRLINAAKDPLIVCDTWFVPVLSLEHKLRPEVRYRLTVEPNLPEIHDDSSTIFAFRPSAHLRHELEQHFGMDLVDRQADLWRLSKREAALRVP